MRVTTSMEQAQFLFNLENINTAMQKVQQQLSTGKTLNLPQDDPVAVSQDMSLTAEVSQVQAGLSTVSSALSWMNATQSAMQGMVSQLQQIQSNLEGALNGPNQSSGDLSGYSATVSQLVQGIYQIADETVGNRYLFGGQADDTAPTTYLLSPGSSIPNGAGPSASAGTNYNPFDDAQASPPNVNEQIAPGIQIRTTVTAYDIFLTTPQGGTRNLRDTLSAIQSDLQSGNTGALRQDLSDLQANLNQVINLNAALGSRIQRMTAAQNQMTQFQTNLTNLKGGIEGADMAQVMTQFSTDQVIYEAALQMGAQILLPSLINYLPS
ncbi:flagellin N-terminal helical domain-containing protein [Alicyclobacillus vulcanalis]|uniref:Flagellin n=1 Tax=Alicyclobacillus vulcanalis TaxID=252246 RepID=A0A1N7JP07_9BACL|nr:flagellin [Alicyclobacillus vulcanalis]SIS50984.1 flagellar hook-associated protein 3 FlgL [Alicyclobacillus vulcanalis]